MIVEEFVVAPVAAYFNNETDGSQPVTAQKVNHPPAVRKIHPPKVCKPVSNDELSGPNLVLHLVAVLRNELQDFNFVFD